MAAESQPSSEYKSQFKWQPSKEKPQLADKKAGRMSAEMGICAEPPLMRRKKSPERSYRTSIARYFIPDDSKVYKKSEAFEDRKTKTAVTESEKRLKEGLNNRGRKGTKECRKKIPVSEYESKYPLPWRFRIRTNISESSVPSLEQEYWYRQVLELRRKADEYEKRARGVNFSREHLAQLIAPRAELWDLSSCNSSIYKRKSNRQLFQTSEENLISDGKEDIYIAPRSHSSPPSSRTHEESSSNTEYQQTIPVIKETDPSQSRKKLAWTESDPPRLHLTDDDDKLQVYISSGPESDEEPGRIPTPELLAQERQMRHHLDRTTPMTGSLLLSPCHSRKAVVDSRRSKSLPRTSTYVVCKDTSSKPVHTSPLQPRRRSRTKVKTRAESTRGKDSLCDCGAIAKAKGSPETAIKLSKPRSAPAQLTHSSQTGKTDPSISKTAVMYEKKVRPNSADVRPSSSPIRDRMCSRTASHSASHPVKYSPPITRKLHESKSHLVNNVGLSSDQVIDKELGRGDAGSSSRLLANEVLQRARTRHKEFWGKNI